VNIDSLSDSGNQPDGAASRRYVSPRRQAQADATRAAIAAAARRLFTERGWAGTRVRDVAREAGVAEPTVYATYGSKAGLAHALVESIGAAADPDRQAAELADAEGEPARQVAAMVAFDRRLYEDGGEILAVLRDAGRSEPALAAAYRAGRAEADQLRHRVVASWPPDTLRDGLDERQAVDVYAAVCSVDTYRELTEERGWSPDQVEGWLHRALCRLVLA
jgi:TetR/AcrR family transcriptional regulator, regulator of cefoperazone and chloramphenicol sensitivity